MGRRTPPAAFSLMEVIVATAILLASTIVLLQLAGIGRESAWRAEDATTAQILCQNELNELLAGIEPLQSVEDQSFPYDPDWTYTVQVDPLDISGLVSVTVTVAKVVTDTGAVADTGLADQTDRHRRGFRLVRWLRQPAVAGGEPTAVPLGAEPSLVPPAPPGNAGPSAVAPTPYPNGP